MSDQSQGQGLQAITYPPGWSVAGWREGTQTSATGAIQQGVNLVLQGPSGAKFTVFVPYNLLGQTQLVEQMINTRISQLGALGAV